LQFSLAGGVPTISSEKNWEIHLKTFESAYCGQFLYAPLGKKRGRMNLTEMGTLD
jgi:hypothetical protein